MSNDDYEQKWRNALSDPQNIAIRPVSKQDVKEGVRNKLSITSILTRKTKHLENLNLRKSVNKLAYKLYFMKKTETRTLSYKSEPYKNVQVLTQNQNAPSLWQFKNSFHLNPECGSRAFGYKEYGKRDTVRSL